MSSAALRLARDATHTHPPPRLLFVANVGWFFLSHRRSLALAARTAGFEVHVACGIEDPAEVSDIRAAGFVCHPLALSRSSRSPHRAVLTALHIRRLVRQLDPQVVHLVALKTILLGGIATPRVRARRVVAAFSGLGHTFTDASVSSRLLRRVLRPAFRFALRGGHCVALFQNDDDRAVFTGAGLIPPERAVLIRGVGVDLRHYTPTPLPDGQPLVVLPARMLREKGVVEFAQAAVMLKEQGVAATLALAGAPDAENPTSLSVAELRELERRCGVRWLGHVSDMRALYQRAALVCLPSYREGMPKALAEAAAVARPIVTTDVPGCREAVVHGVNGMLVPPMNASALAGALRALLGDRSLMERMAAASRTLAEQRFDERALISQTLALYERAS